MTVSPCLLVLFAQVALAQSAPDEDWNRFSPNEQPPASAQQPRTPSPWEPSPQPTAPQFVRPPPLIVDDAYRPTPKRLLEPNNVSLSAANSLGQWRRAFGAVFGFPLFGVRASLGVLERLDLGIQFDSVYTQLNELRGTVRFRLTDGTRGAWQAAVVFDGGGAFFRDRAAREIRGPRWLTGRRNFNFVPGMVFSYEARATRSTRFFIDLRYMLTLDTEPFSRDPLEGVPPALRVGHNALVKAGAEAPLSETTALSFSLGLEFHGDSRDSAVMPSILVGLVFSL